MTRDKRAGPVISQPYQHVRRRELNGRLIEKDKLARPYVRRLRWDIILPIIAVGADAISAALEQTSPHKVIAARYGVIMAIVSVLLTVSDLACNKYMLIRDKNTRPKWEFADSFGFISSILTLISSCLHYNFLSNGKQQPIRFSMIPLAFSVCVFCSRVLRQPSHKHKPIFVFNCKHLGLINLEIESGGILFDNDEPTQFVCPVCQIEQIHPQGV
uniref:Uncharacterized protein n=1 Tax=Manihot esculenta TaxID=3983 RepID=A0A199U9P3_MANES